MSNKEQLLIASLLSAIVVYWVYLQNKPEKLSNQQLYSMFYRPYDLDSVVYQISDDDTVYLGLEHYRRGEFDDAEEIFENAFHLDSLSNNNKWFLAQAKMAQNEVYASIPLLAALRDSSDFHQEADWYLALAYLRYGDIDATTTCLKRLDTLNYRHQEVTNLLELIE